MRGGYIYVAQPSPGRRRGGEAERRELQSVAGGSECAIWLGTVLQFPKRKLFRLGLARHHTKMQRAMGPLLTVCFHWATFSRPPVQAVVNRPNKTVVLG